MNRLYGTELDRGEYEHQHNACRSVIHGIERSHSGNLVLRVGHEDTPGGSYHQTEHVVMTPGEAQAFLREVTQRLNRIEDGAKVYPDPDADANGTSIKGYLDPITYTELVAKLGEPHRGVSGDNKVDAEWFFQTPAGEATIYNYKSGPAYNPGENISLADVDDWHIGGKSEAVVEYIREYVASR